MLYLLCLILGLLVGTTVMEKRVNPDKDFPSLVMDGFVSFLKNKPSKPAEKKGGEEEDKKEEKGE